MIYSPVKGANMLRHYCVQSAKVLNLVRRARIRREMNIPLLLFIITFLLNQLRFSLSFRTTIPYHHRTITIKPLYLSDQVDGLDGGDSDSNKWVSSDAMGGGEDDDWEQTLENQEN